MELYQIPLIILLGFGSAFLNTVGGGGSLFTVPILTFMGVPITMANATARVAILAQNITAVGGFRSKKVELPLRYSLTLGLVSMVGGFIGSMLASTIDDKIFGRIFVLVMLLSIALVIFDPFRSTMQGENMTPRRQRIGILCFFFVGIYGGFVQAGVGFLVIGILSLVNHFNLVKTNYIKVFVAIVYTGVSVAVFAYQDKILWLTSLILAIGHALGGWYASRWSVDKGEVWIKRVMVISVIGMAIKLWFF
ncbi:MAG: sulfite exporter TauE/SafE family protein [Cyclobacteriaceae bacterium]|nr:sulfite exporter TauE/SafE family protein [Cyclobacteriaceae bacterium]MDH4295968.1 sulfite exporter TauE/SafE family protein [Cyclobacteriaceae bacterium]MDH5250127.1 sulfite exporter TauE/SafE family protein [Cyclobacteriaceae bacterium]